MGCVKFLDHFNACAAVFCDLIDVRPFHQAQTDVGVPKAVGCATVSIPVKFKIKFVKNDADVQSYDAEMSADYKSRIARLESEVSEAELAHTTFDELLEFSRSGLKNVALARSEADMNLKQKSSRHPVSGGFRV